MSSRATTQSPSAWGTRARIGERIWPRTAEEIAEVLTPQRLYFSSSDGPVIDVRRFGAERGEDATTAIRNARDVCPEGGAVLIPDDYFTDELELEDWNNRSIIGPGTLRLLPGSASNAGIIRLSGTTDNVTIQGVRFIGLGPSSDADRGGIIAGPSASISSIRVLGCKFKHLNFGAYVAGHADTGDDDPYGGWCFAFNYFEDIIGTTTGRGLGIVMESRDDSEEPLQVFVLSNGFRRTQRHGVYMGLGHQIALTVACNEFDHHRFGVAEVTQRPAVTIGRCRGANVLGNTFTRCADGSVDVFFDDTQELSAEQVLITGNRFVDRANAWPDLTIGVSTEPDTARATDVDVVGNQFIADQDTAGAQPFVELLNGQRIVIAENTMRLRNADNAQYFVRVGSVVDVAADCDEVVIEHNRAFAEGASAGSCRFVVLSADVCTNTSKIRIARNRLFGPQYVEFGATPTNTQLHVDVTGTVNLAITGLTTAPTGDVPYTVSAEREVTLRVPVIAGTSNTTACQLQTLPALLRPASARIVPCIVQNNSVVVWSRAVIQTNGVILLHNNMNPVFTASGGKGVDECILRYPLDD